MDNKLQIQYNLHPATLERWEQIKTVSPYKFSQATALRCVDMVAIWPKLKPATFDDAIKAVQYSYGKEQCASNKKPPHSL